MSTVSGITEGGGSEEVKSLEESTEDLVDLVDITGIERIPETLLRTLVTGQAVV